MSYQAASSCEGVKRGAFKFIINYIKVFDPCLPSIDIAYICSSESKWFGCKSWELGRGFRFLLTSLAKTSGSCIGMCTVTLQGCRLRFLECSWEKWLLGWITAYNLGFWTFLCQTPSEWCRTRDPLEISRAAKISRQFRNIFSEEPSAWLDSVR